MKYTEKAANELRRPDRGMTEDEPWMRDMLHKASVGVLAMVFDGQPFVNTNLFVYDEEAHVVYTHTARVGRTRANLEINDRVCFSVSEIGRLLPADEALEFSVEYAGVTLFGICYGHQLLAHALGGEVGDNPAGREMGTVEIALDASATDDPLFAGLPARLRAQTTHLQTVLRPPSDATVLAGSEQDPCHAFRWGGHAWGVQFHPEFSTTHMRGYVHARREALAGEGRCARELSRKIGATPHARRVLRRFVRHAHAQAG